MVPDEVLEVLDSGADERTEFETLPEGHYLCQIEKIVEKDGKEYPYMECEWKVLQPREHKGRKLWDNISFNPKAAFKVRALFDAFDYDYDSDTDEFVQEKEQAVLYVKQEIQEQGKKKGQLREVVDEVLPADEENMDLVEE
jgi:hypothetical protein